MIMGWRHRGRTHGIFKGHENVLMYFEIRRKKEHELALKEMSSPIMSICLYRYQHSYLFGFDLFREEEAQEGRSALGGRHEAGSSLGEGGP